MERYFPVYGGSAAAMAAGAADAQADNVRLLELLERSAARPVERINFIVPDAAPYRLRMPVPVTVTEASAEIEGAPRTVVPSSTPAAGQIGLDPTTGLVTFHVSDADATGWIEYRQLASPPTAEFLSYLQGVVDAAVQRGLASVLGPSSSVSGRVPRWANASGRVLDQSLVSIDAAGNLIFPDSGLNPSVGVNWRQDSQTASIYWDFEFDLLEVSGNIQMLGGQAGFNVWKQPGGAGSTLIEYLTSSFVMAHRQVSGFPLGSSAMPSITFTDSLTQGFYRIDSNAIGIVAAAGAVWEVRNTALLPPTNDGQALGSSIRQIAEVFVGNKLRTGQGRALVRRESTGRIETIQGLNSTIDFTDGDQNTNQVTIVDGIITNWEVL